jgi:hypothetical protein
VFTGVVAGKRAPAPVFRSCPDLCGFSLYKEYVLLTPFLGRFRAKPLIYKGWQSASKLFKKNAQATCHRDDNYYEGSLGTPGDCRGREAT